MFLSCCRSHFHAGSRLAVICHICGHLWNKDREEFLWHSFSLITFSTVNTWCMLETAWSVVQRPQHWLKFAASAYSQRSTSSLYACLFQSVLLLSSQSRPNQNSQQALSFYTAHKITVYCFVSCDCKMTRLVAHFNALQQIQWIASDCWWLSVGL